MHKSGYYLSVALLTSFLFILLQCSNEKQETLAQVESITITTDDFQSRYQKFLTSTGVSDRPTARRQLLDGMIGEILLLNLNDNQHIFNDPEYQAMQERIRRELLLGYYRAQEVIKKISISEADLRKEFIHVNERLSARHLFVRNKEEADKLYNQLQNGYTFQQLAPLVFEDDSLANNGGYLGYFTWGDMDPAFEEVAYGLKPGEISKPVQTDYGYSIIKLEDRVRHPLLTEDEFTRKKNSLRRMVYIRMKNQVEKKMLNDIIEKININIDTQNLSYLAGKLGIGSIHKNWGGEPNPGGRIVITYGDKSMTVDEAFAAINDLAPSNKGRIRSARALNAALSGLAVQDWLLEDAELMGYDKAPDYLKQEELWSNEKFLQFKRRRIFEDIKLPDSLAYAYYLDNKSEFIREERVNVQEILVSSAKEARDLVNSLKKGADFTAMARKISLRQTAANSDGILGLEPLSRYGNLKEHFKEAPRNKIIGPLKVDEFYVIARVIDREESRLFEYDEVKSVIVETLKKNKERENFAAYVDSLRSEYPVSVNDQLLMDLKLEIN